MGRGRAPCCEKVGLNRGSWTAEEDMRLMAYIQKHGHANWRALPKQAGLLRCGKSCRLRWINYLRPDIKRGNFTKDEEDTIMKLHGLLGNKWSRIASCLPRRTDNEIKNVWNTHLKKRLAPKERNPPPSKTEEVPSSPSTSTSISSSNKSDQGNSSKHSMNTDSNSIGTYEVLGKNKESSIEKIEIPIELSFDMSDMLEDSIFHLPEYPACEEKDALDLPLNKCLAPSTSNASEGVCKQSPSSSLSNSFEPSKDASKESSCSSSSYSFTTTCSVGEEGLSHDPLDVVLDAPINLELWDMVEDSSISFVSEVEEGLVHQKALSSLEEESNKQDESKGWLAYLEKELGLWGANEDIQQSMKRDAGEIDCDPISSYFQSGFSSPSSL